MAGAGSEPSRWHQNPPKRGRVSLQLSDFGQKRGEKRHRRGPLGRKCRFWTICEPWGSATGRQVNAGGSRPHRGHVPSSAPGRWGGNLTGLHNHTQRPGRWSYQSHDQALPELGQCGRSLGGPGACHPTLLCPKFKLVPPTPCCPEAPGQASRHRGPCAWRTFLESLPSILCASSRRPLVHTHAQHRLPVTHQLLTGRPLPLIPFLFGFNEPNPLSRHDDKGEVIREQAAFGGESRKVTLSLRPGASRPLLSAHTPHIIHTTAPRAGSIAVPTHRAGCCLMGLHSVCRHGGGEGQSLLGPFASPRCMSAHPPPEENKWVLGLERSPSNLWALLSKRGRLARPLR